MSSAFLSALSDSSEFSLLKLRLLQPRRNRVTQSVVTRGISIYISINGLHPLVTIGPVVMLFGRRLGVAGVIHSWKRPSHGLSGANPLLRRRATFVCVRCRRGSVSRTHFACDGATRHVTSIFMIFLECVMRLSFVPFLMQSQIPSTYIFKDTQRRDYYEFTLRSLTHVETRWLTST